MIRDPILVPTVDTYVDWHYIKHYIAIKCQKFEVTGRTLWRVLVPSNASEGFPSVPCERGYLKKRAFDQQQP